MPVLILFPGEIHYVMPGPLYAVAINVLFLVWLSSSNSILLCEKKFLNSFYEHFVLMLSLLMMNPLFTSKVMCRQHVSFFILLVSKGLSTEVTFQSVVTAMLGIAVAQKSAATVKTLVTVKALQAVRPALMAVPRHRLLEQAWTFRTLQHING